MFSLISGANADAFVLVFTAVGEQNGAFISLRARYFKRTVDIGLSKKKAIKTTLDKC